MPALPMTADLSTLNGGTTPPPSTSAPAVDEGSVTFNEGGDDFKVEKSTEVPESTPEPAPVKQQQVRKPTPELDVKLEYEKLKPEVTSTPTPAPEATPTQRDYSGLDPEVAEIAKNFRNKQFAELTPKIAEWHKAAKEAASLREQLAAKPTEPLYGYEHPEAYLLDNEYRSMNNLSQKIDFEVDHWERQLELINSGEDWYQLTGYDQNGAPKYVMHKAGNDGKIDQRSAAQVQRLLSESIQGQQIAAQRLNAVRQQYASKHADAAKELADVEARLMPSIKEESFTPDEKQWYDAALKSAPKRFQGHPMQKTLGKMYVAFMRLYNYTKSTETELATLKKNQAAAVLGGPRVTSLGAKKSANADEDTEVKFSDFE